MAKNRIILFIPYFGKWPEWFSLYLHSCANVPIDFQFFTDCEAPEEHPGNVRFQTTTFNEYCAAASEALGICFHPSSPYKLCDLKPFYGFIHKELASQYDFWGFGDIDLVYGDMRGLLSDKMLDRYDVITTHSDRIAGHFCILRTGSKISEKCLQIKEWQRKLTEQNHLALDEKDLTLAIYPEIKFNYKVYRIIEKLGVKTDMNRFLNRMNLLFCNRLTHRHFIEYWTTPVPEDGQTWRWDLLSGEIINPSKRSIPYLHFLFFKKNKYKELPVHWDENSFKTCENPLEKKAVCFSLSKISYE